MTASEATLGMLLRGLRLTTFANNYEDLGQQAETKVHVRL
jgi:hypothetical protein